MARESCNLNKDEAEILKPSPPSASLFLKPAQEFSLAQQRTESTAANPAVAAVVGDSRTDGEPPQQAVAAVRFGNRCSSCRKKVGLTGFRCRCGDLFCGRHRYSDNHECSFDYKAAGREEISKNNPVIRAAKIIKI